MWRLRYVLLSLVLFPAPLVGQVQVSLLTPSEPFTFGAQIQALERSREALLEARASVETAIGEVDRVLETLRQTASPCDQPALVQRGSPSPGAPPELELLASLRRAIQGHWSDFAELRKLMADAACVLASREEPRAPSLPVHPDPEPAIAARPVLATSREVEILGGTTPGEPSPSPGNPPASSEVPAKQPEAAPSRSMEEVGLERGQPVLTALDTRESAPVDEPEAPRLPAVDGQAALAPSSDE